MNHVRVWYVPRLRCLTGVSVGGRQETMIEAIDGEMDTATAKLTATALPRLASSTSLHLNNPSSSLSRQTSATHVELALLY